MAAIFRNAKVRQYALLGFLATVMLGAALWYFGSRYQWVEDKWRTGMTGEARRNPLHAAQLLFQRLDMPSHKIEDLRGLFELPPNATVVLWTAQALDKDQVERFAQWVERGGRVVLDADNGLLNTRLGIQVVGSYRAKKIDDPHTQLSIDGRKLTVELPWASLLDSAHPVQQNVTITGGRLWSRQKAEGCPIPNDDSEEEHDTEEDEAIVAAPEDLDQQEHGGNVLVHYALGKGHVTAVGNIEMFGNDMIADHDHAEYLTRVVRQAGNPNAIYLAPDPQYPNLIGWLMQHAWPALLTAVVLLAVALWRAMPRFGPLESSPPSARPGLLQHLRAVAEFHLKNHHFAALLGPLQEDCLRALQLHAAREGMTSEPAALARRLTGLPAADIERALRAVPIHRTEFLHHVSTLSRIRDALLPSHRHVVPGSTK